MISTNAYGTYSTNSSYTNPIVWSETAEAYIYEKSVFQAFGIINLEQLNRPGRQYNLTLDTGASLGRLTEGVATPISATSFNQVTVVFYGYGDAKQITDEQMVTGEAFVGATDRIYTNALGAWSENRDSVIVTELMTTSSTGIYPNGKASGTIASTDTFNTVMIADVKSTMKTTQARQLQAIVVHPAQENSLFKLPNFVNAGQYGAGTIIQSGEIGSYLGTKILASNHITTATENGITVYKAIALGLKPFVFMPKRRFSFQIGIENIRERAITFHYWEMFGTSIYKDASVIVLTSAGGI